MPHPSDDEQKELFKQAIKEWMDAQFAAFGKFSLAAIISLIFGATVFLYIKTGGFK